MISFTIFIVVVVALNLFILWLLYRKAVDHEVAKILAERITTLKKESNYKDIIIGFFTIKYGEIIQEDFDDYVKTHKKEIRNFPS